MSRYKTPRRQNNRLNQNTRRRRVLLPAVKEKEEQQEVNVRKLIEVLFPHLAHDAIEKVIGQFETIRQRTKAMKEIPMAPPGKNQDYQKGYEIGALLSIEGEDLDPKDLHQTAHEVLDELDFGQLQVTNPEYFTDGVYNGYVITTMLVVDPDEETPS